MGTPTMPRMKILLLLGGILALPQAPKAYSGKYPSSGILCDGGRRYLCKYCEKTCKNYVDGNECPEDPKLEDYADEPAWFPECNWGCYCDDDSYWSEWDGKCLDSLDQCKGDWRAAALLSY